MTKKTYLFDLLISLPKPYCNVFISAKFWHYGVYVFTPKNILAYFLLVVELDTILGPDR